MVRTCRRRRRAPLIGGHPSRESCTRWAPMAAGAFFPCIGSSSPMFPCSKSWRTAWCGPQSHHSPPPGRVAELAQRGRSTRFPSKPDHAPRDVAAHRSELVSFHLGCHSRRGARVKPRLFPNPLVNVALGVLFLRERLHPWQTGSVALAALGVVTLAFSAGGLPWISLALALSFGVYALLRKVAPMAPWSPSRSRPRSCARLPPSTSRGSKRTGEVHS